MVLDTGDPGPYEDFAPSAAALPDGGWLVVWTRGPRVSERRDPSPQQVLFRRFGASLQPVGDATPASTAGSASDGRVVARDGRFLIAMMGNRSGDRSVQVVAGSCRADR
ncbi:MAG: hypothetical protein U0324_08430 [Polyangiales bacterium]